MMNTNGLLYWDACYTSIDKNLILFPELKLVRKYSRIANKLHANV